MWLAVTLSGWTLALGAGTARASAPGTLSPDLAPPAPAPAPTESLEPTAQPVEPALEPTVQPVESVPAQAEPAPLRAELAPLPVEPAPLRAESTPQPHDPVEPAATEPSGPAGHGQMAVDGLADLPPPAAAAPAPAVPAPPPPQAPAAPTPATDEAPEPPADATRDDEGATPGPKRAEGERLLGEVDTRLRRVEANLERVNTHVHAGAEPPESELRVLRTGLEQLAPALAALERHISAFPGERLDTRGIDRRLRHARAAARDLLVELAGLGVHSPEGVRLAAELERFAGSSSTVAAHGVAQPQPAYTQYAAAPSRSRSGIGAASSGRATTRAAPRDGQAAGPESLYFPLTGSAQASGGFTVLFTGGPAALALLLALALPRLLRRLAHSPARRQPAWFPLPLERPG